MQSTQRGSPREAAAVGGKFAYAGGARPLEGYTIKRGVGHGGFGEVYYATSDAGKEVALKLIRRNLDVELRGIKQCLNLKHPNLLTVYDIREDDHGDHWVVMEYVAGECLDDAIADHPKGMPIERVLAWFHGIAGGVAYLHDHGIVHRDLKPGNLFSDEGRVEIGDYGLSKFVSCSRRSGQTESVGTVHYMAPEVANGRYGKEIDIYALGIILYEMLTGQVPFEGESVGEVLMKHLTARPDVSMLDEPYRTVVARALEKDPAKRYQSVTEMVAYLPKPGGAAGATGTLPPGAAERSREIPADAKVLPDHAADEEPILKAVRELWQEAHDAWNRSKLNAPVKAILLVAGLALLLISSEFLLPIAMLTLIAYGVYRVARAIVLSGKTAHASSARPAAPPSQPRPAAPHRRAARHTIPTWAQQREQIAASLLAKSPRRRLTELLGSSVVGALVAAVMCLVVCILNGFHTDLPRPEQCAWLLLTSIVGTWAILIPSKFWEGSEGEVILRRFIMMVIGFALGAAAFASAELLMVHLTFDPSFDHPDSYSFPPSFYGTDGTPGLLAYMAVFGTLFFAIRWWKQTDPLRATRLRLGALFGALILSGLIAALWHFPQPWLIMVACVVSASVQLSSPWLPPRRRKLRNPVL